jgi:hypothetical protein
LCPFIVPLERDRALASHGKEETKMKKERIMPILLTLLFALIFSGIALGDGGGFFPPPAIQLPKPDSGPFLKGTFTAAYDQLNPDRYDIHVILEKEETTFGCAKREGGVKHLFSFHVEKTSSSKPICKYTKEELMNKYEYAPHRMKAGEKFNLQGIPVLTEMSLTHWENCGDAGDTSEAIVYGTIRIRVVPSQSK